MKTLPPHFAYCSMQTSSKIDLLKQQFFFSLFGSKSQLVLTVVQYIRCDTLLARCATKRNICSVDTTQQLARLRQTDSVTGPFDQMGRPPPLRNNASVKSL